MLLLRIILFTITLLFLFSLNAQNTTLSDAQLTYTYQEINRTDQTHIKNNEIRHLIFRKNFNTIISIIKTQGYPTLIIAPKKKKDKNLIYNTTFTAFFHILQSYPELLLNQETIKLLNSEIQLGRMPKILLKETLTTWKKANEISNNKYPQIISKETLTLYNNALRILKIEP